MISGINLTKQIHKNNIFQIETSKLNYKLSLFSVEEERYPFLQSQLFKIRQTGLFNFKICKFCIFM